MSALIKVLLGPTTLTLAVASRTEGLLTFELGNTWFVAATVLLIKCSFPGKSSD